MKDSLRDKVKSCVAYARDQCGLTVRLVSGDHYDTAVAIAQKAGILRSQEVHDSNAVMTGESFREQVGPLVQHRDAETGNIAL